MVDIWLLLRKNEITYLKTLFWRHVHRFEDVLIQSFRKKWQPYWVNLLFWVHLIIFYFSKSKLILLSYRVVYLYTRIFPNLLPHTVGEGKLWIQCSSLVVVWYHVRISIPKKSCTCIHAPNRLNPNQSNASPSTGLLTQSEPHRAPSRIRTSVAYSISNELNTNTECVSSIRLHGCVER